MKDLFKVTVKIGKTERNSVSVSVCYNRECFFYDKTAGSPAPNTVFITNGKSVLNGQKRALLKVKPKRDINTPKNEIVKNHFVDANKMVEKTEIPIFPAKTVNDLARSVFSITANVL